MATTTIEHYLIDANKVQGFDEELGEFICGFSEENKSFIWTNILWIFCFPFGPFILLGFAIRYWWVKSHPRRILSFKGGFIRQTLNGRGEVKKERLFNFNKLNGLLCRRTLHYQNIYGFRKYKCTTVELSVLDSDNAKVAILSGSYRNEYEVEGNYNFVGYSCNAINDAWVRFSLQRFNKEFSEKGYGTFITSKGNVFVGKDFIKINGVVVSHGFKYSFDNGYLYLYPNAAEGAHFKYKCKPVAINVSEMYDNEVFLMAMRQIHGVG